MRLWRRGDGDEVDDEVVQRRLVRVVGPAAGVYGLSPDPGDADPSSGGDPSGDGAGGDGAGEGSPGDPPEPSSVDPVVAGRALAAFDPGRRGVRALAVVAVLAALLVGGAVWWSRPRAQPVGVPSPVPAALAGAPPGPPGPPAAALSSPSVIIVAVAGRVQRPGLVRVPPGARVADVIDAAGGVLPGTDISFVNLARKVVDGELLVIGVSAPPGVGGQPGGPAAPGAPAQVNLNTASVAELDTLPGVGPVLAQRIIDYRTRHSGFRSVDELRKVDGLGDARYAQLKELVTV